MNGFRVLGTNAAPAIPQLVALMTGTSDRAIVFRAVEALSGLGAPAFPHLVSALSNPSQLGRPMIVAKIWDMAHNVGTNACLTSLKAALQDPDPDVSAAASRALSVLAPDFLTNAPAQ